MNYGFKVTDSSEKLNETIYSGLNVLFANWAHNYTRFYTYIKHIKWTGVPIKEITGYLTVQKFGDFFISFKPIIISLTFGCYCMTYNLHKLKLYYSIVLVLGPLDLYVIEIACFQYLEVLMIG